MALFRKRYPPVTEALQKLLVTYASDLRADRSLELRNVARYQEEIQAAIAALDPNDEPRLLSVGYGLSLGGAVYEDADAQMLLVTDLQSLKLAPLSDELRVEAIRHADLTALDSERDPGPPLMRVTRLRLTAGDRMISHPLLSQAAADSLAQTILDLRGSATAMA